MSGLMKRTGVALAPPVKNLYRRTDFPNIQNRKNERYSFKEYFGRVNGLRPWASGGMWNFAKLGLDEKFKSSIGYTIFPLNAFRMPKRSMQRGMHGYNYYPRAEAYTPYRTIMEKMTETGELLGQNGEMRPELFQQTWFTKKVQYRRALTWSEKRSKFRIFPNVYGWNQDAHPISVYSELLDHQFRPAIEHDALMHLESYGGVDQWVLQNDPTFLTSWEMEVLRNYMLVRRMELNKNFVMDRQSEKLAEHLLVLIREKYEREKAERIEEGEHDEAKAVEA